MNRSPHAITETITHCATIGEAVGKAAAAALDRTVPADADLTRYEASLVALLASVISEVAQRSHCNAAELVANALEHAGGCGNLPARVAFEFASCDGTLGA